MKRSRLISLLGFVTFSAAAIYWTPTAIAERDRDDRAQATQRAARHAMLAQKAIAAQKGSRAIKAAEEAVRAMPRSSEYRALLGEAYLAAGRFQSAQSAFADALVLQPENDRAAFKLALLRIARGEGAEARDMIDARQSALSVEDYALARALTGDPAGAAGLLETAVRAGEANAKTRQNLAFVYAVAGRWVDARRMAARDLPPDAVSNRIGQWAMVMRSGAERDRIALLLGIVPAPDQGLPVALRLQSSSDSSAALEPALAIAPSSPQSVEPAPASSPEALYETEAPSEVQPAIPYFPSRRTQKSAALPNQADASAPKMSRRATQQWGAALTPGRTFVVQLGAFSSARNAADAWRRMTKKYRSLQKLDGRQAQFKLGQTTFYRLSVGFPSRVAARDMCQKLRGQGSPCFVRVLNAQDQVRWAARPLRKPTLLALRPPFDQPSTRPPLTVEITRP